MPQRPLITLLITLSAVAALSVLPACETGSRFGPRPSVDSTFVPVSKMHAAFDRGDYARAYELSAGAGDQARHRHRFEAAHIAGLSALRLDKPGPAEHYLRVAFRGTNNSRIRGDAGANLGMLFYRQERYRYAANTLLQAAQDLQSKTDRANAYYYAARCEQRLGRMPGARTHYLLARGLTKDADLRARINRRLDVTGYTIQIGGYQTKAKARQAAADLNERAGTNYTTKLVPAPGNSGKTMVHVGQFSTFGSADQIRRRLNLQESVIVPLAQQSSGQSKAK